MPRRPNPPREETIERERRVLELRRAGATFETIANTLGLSHRSDAAKICKRAMARPLIEPARELRQLEATRLDELQYAVWNKALNGDLDAFDRVLKVMERRAKLFGLDHSAKIAEAQLALEADKVRLIAMAFGKALDQVDLTAEQRASMTRVLLTELRATADPGDDPEDETQAAGP